MCHQSEKKETADKIFIDFASNAKKNSLGWLVFCSLYIQFQWDPPEAEAIIIFPVGVSYM